jgi:HK97 gp10 family phage protein
MTKKQAFSIDQKALDKSIKDIVKALDDMPEKLQNQVLNFSTRKGAVVVQDNAKTFAPVDTGALRDGIKVKKLPKRKTPKNQVVYQVGLLPHVFYGMFVEFGTKFQSANPFMTPASERVEEVLDAVKRYTVQKFDNVMKKINKNKQG